VRDTAHAFALIRLLDTQAIFIGISTIEPFQLVRLDRCLLRVLAFATGKPVRLKPWHLEFPCLPEYPAHVPQGHNISLSLALPRAFAFWAILPIDAYDWLSSPANAGEPSIGYSPIVRGMLSVPKVHWFVALGRHFALRAFGNAGDRKGWISSMQGLDDPGLIPVWACGSTVCAGST
jgi:hypothetical protein